MEVDIDIGSSTVANNIVRFVLGYDVYPQVLNYHSAHRHVLPASCRYVRTLVVDMCFLIEGKRDDELPVRVLQLKVINIEQSYLQEQLIGTSRVAHLEPESAVAPPSVG